MTNESPRVLISGPDLHEYNQSIGRGFEQAGCRVEVSDWPTLEMGPLIHLPRHISEFAGDHLPEWFTRQTATDKVEQNEDTVREYNEILLREVERTNPDIVLIIKGNIIFPETVRRLQAKDGVTVVNWCYDRVERFPNVVEGAKYYDQVYVYDPVDVDVLSDYGIESNHLMDAYDPYYYQNESIEQKEYDVSFIGKWRTGQREEILREITQEFDDRNIGIWGGSWAWYNPFAQYKYRVKHRTFGNSIRNWNVEPKRANEIYNTSKICLNIHCGQADQGLNMRTFETLAAGGFQLVDYLEILEDYFTVGEDIAVYRNVDELIETIEYYLENEDERREIAQNGHETVRESHTFENRAREILDDIWEGS
jgi:spore maturation protein CgeB